MENRATSIAIKGLTGAVALAGANQTYGQVVAANPPATLALVTTDNGSTTTESDVSTTFDVDGDGTPDFVLQVDVLPTGYTGLSKALAETHIYGLTGEVVGYTNTFTNGTFAYVSKLTLGTTVGPSSTFVQEPDYYTNIGIKYGSKSYGKFTSGTGYIGFEFTAADTMLHYGYVEFTTTLTATTNALAKATLTYVGAYYQETPNTAITIGAVVPEPSSLAALAFGAAGMAGAAAYRRKQTAAATLAA
jgi:hypothetical protein